jgi:hypothetical protein
MLVSISLICHRMYIMDVHLISKIMDRRLFLHKYMHSNPIFIVHTSYLTFPSYSMTMETPLTKTEGHWPPPLKITPNLIITTLETDYGELPVYWSHYVSWLTVANSGLRSLINKSESMEHEFDLCMDISAEDYEWTRLSLNMIEAVKRKALSCPHQPRPLTSRLQ